MIDPSIVGNTGAEELFEWNADDALLYALAVGAGSSPGLDEIAFTVDGAVGVEHVAVPSMILVLRDGGEPDMGPLDQRSFLHAEQSFRLHRPLPTSGALRSTTRVSQVWDKGAGGLIVRETECVDAASGQPLATLTDSLFVRGGGGFGGPPQPTGDWVAPEEPAGLEVVHETRLEQALIYRLTGDRNPIHADPVIAQQAGFSTPILHGMCTYGFACRALLSAVAPGRPDRLAAMSARFTSTVTPGDTLTTSVWAGDGRGQFQVRNHKDEIVLDRGTYQLT